MLNGVNTVLARVKKKIITILRKLRKRIEENEFELKEIDEIRREVGKLDITVYNKLIEIEMAEKTHASEADVFVCKICGREYTSKNSINAHLIRHHHVKPSEEYIDRIKFPEM